MAMPHLGLLFLGLALVIVPALVLLVVARLMNARGALDDAPDWALGLVTLDFACCQLPFFLAFMVLGVALIIGAFAS